MIYSFRGGDLVNYYEINDETLAIIPFEHNKSKILEKNDEYIIDETPYSIMENSCRYFGSSLEGRINGSKDILGSIYKIPIMVEESQRLIFFPTEALNSPNVGFISYRNIKNVNKHGTKSIVEFKNGNGIVINCPYFSMKNQIFRCNMLDSVSDDRKRRKKTMND